MKRSKLVVFVSLSTLVVLSAQFYSRKVREVKKEERIERMIDKKIQERMKSIPRLQKKKVD